MKAMISKALVPYQIGSKSLVVEKELHTNSWHHDLHYKIIADGVPYSARFIGYGRSQNEVFGEITDEILKEQVNFCEFLVNYEIPFMRLVLRKNNEPFLYFDWENKIYRFILFEWIDGKHITHCDESIAATFGNMARKFHDESSKFDSTVFKKQSHLIGYSKFVETIREKMANNQLTKETTQLLDDYLVFAESHIENARTNDFDFLIQSDLNPLNILWDEGKKIIGIVDFESIGYTDRIEGLAWLIKWYSRTNGIDSIEMSPSVSKAFIKAYNPDVIIGEKDFKRLSSLIWLSGCINWNFVKRTVEILDMKHNENELKAHIELYLKRGERLSTLLN